MDDSVSTGMLKVERQADVLTLVLDRPASANALSASLVEALISELENLDGIRLCVIRGNGRHFCAGFDLSDLDKLSDGDLLWRFLRIEHMLQLVHYALVPVLVLAHGQTIGAGADLFVAGWQRVAAPDMRLRLPGWNFGLALGTRRLSQLVGSQCAADILIDTRQLTAEEALDCGIASTVADADASTFNTCIDEALQRASHLPADALASMLSLNRTDTRDQDIASIVKTAGRPGLRNRIENYRNQLLQNKSKKREAPCPT